MAIEKLLLVEDNPQYRRTAEETLNGRNYSVATNYDEAIDKLNSADVIITDVFFQQNKSGTSPELQIKAVEAIKYGLIKKYVQQISAKVKAEAGIEIDDRLRKCFETIGYHHLGCSEGYNPSSSLDQSIIMYARCFKEKTAEKLEEAVNDMIGVASEGVVKKLFKPLEDYMKRDSSNQPLGYLIAEEAEKLGKPFVLVTSLRHAQTSLVPILRSAKARDWKMLEGGDGSKETPEYWIKAYEQLKGGRRNGK